MTFYDLSLEDREIYLDLFCEGRRPRDLTPDSVQHPDEYGQEQARETDEEKARTGYER